MICIIALIVFAILALFSAKYRPLAAESFDCVFRRVTFRKCTSRLDQRLKAQLTGKAMKKNKALGRFLFKYFEVFSWVLLILMVLSTWQTGVAVYNYSVYGNCNGPGETGFCIFDPLGTNNQVVDDGVCPAPGTTPDGGTLTPPPQELIEANPRLGSTQAKVLVVEYGCYSCPNTAVQAPAIKQMIEDYGEQIQFAYIDFPLSQHDFSQEAAISAQCVYEYGAKQYWNYHFTLFEQQEQISIENLQSWALELGMTQEEYDSCIVNEKTQMAVQANLDAGLTSGIYGTPTFFINEQSLVGKQTLSQLKKIIDEELQK